MTTAQLGAYWKAQFKAAPAKFIALGSLGLVLLIVVGLQVLGDPAAAGAAGVIAAPAVVTAVSPTPSAALETGPVAAPRPPLPPLPEELARNLFALLPAPPPDAESPSLPDEENPAPLSDDKNPEPADLVLQATYESTGTSPFLLAVVNGQELRVGERVGEWEIESIRSREVTLRSGVGSVILRMP